MWIKKIILPLLLVIVLSTIVIISFGENQEENLRISQIHQTPFVGPTVYDIPFESYEAFDETLVEEKSFIHKINVISVGDIMAHTIQLEAAKTENGYDFYPQLEEIKDKISSKDFAIGNLETVMAGEDRRYSGKNMIFNTPDNLAVSLKKAGFDILTTANNHALDRGFYGVKRTQEVLEKEGLLYTGTYTSDERDILTFSKDGFSFALLSYSFSTNGWPMPEENPHTLNMMEREIIYKDIERAKEMAVDFIIVANHWGLEYHLDENHHQRDLTHDLFYAGADIILGTHPHVLQPFDHIKMKDSSGMYKDKFVIYSQGNFLSGQRTYPRAIGMYINFEFERNGSQKYVSEVSVMPTYVESGYKNGKRFMRVLDVYQSRLDYDAGQLDMSSSLYQNLQVYERDFIEHLSSKVQMTPYLNENNEYVIYEVN